MGGWACYGVSYEGLYRAQMYTQALIVIIAANEIGAQSKYPGWLRLSAIVASREGQFRFSANDAGAALWLYSGTGPPYEFQLYWEWKGTEIVETWVKYNPPQRVPRQNIRYPRTSGSTASSSNGQV